MAPKKNKLEESLLESKNNELVEVETKPKPKGRTKKEKPAAPKQGKEKVAIKSTKNVSWMGVGQVKVGINYVSAEEAKEWSKRNHITVLKPEEVAKEYGL